jgi:hypothetical protein
MRLVKLVYLELGGLYLVKWFNNEPILCKLVKVTPKGFNLLKVKENKMFLYPHLYPSKKHEQSELQKVFFINQNLNITKYYGKSNY